METTDQLTTPAGSAGSEDQRAQIIKATAEGLEPGSDKELSMVRAFQAARRGEEKERVLSSIGTPEEPGPIAEDLRAAEEGQGNSYVRPEDSQAAHHPNEIAITREGGQNGDSVPVQPVPGPLEANNNPDTGLVDVSRLQMAQQSPATGIRGSLTPQINPRPPGVIRKG